MKLDSVINNLKSFSKEFLPVKVCLKYHPPSLALCYKLSSFPEQYFFHKVIIEKEIEEMTPEDIYTKLLDKESVYWNQNNISKRQIIHLVIKLQKKTFEVSPLEYVITQYREDKSSYIRQLTIESNLCESPVLITDMEELIMPNSENIIVNECGGSSKKQGDLEDKCSPTKSTMQSENRLSIESELMSKNGKISKFVTEHWIKFVLTYPLSDERFLIGEAIKAK